MTGAERDPVALLAAAAGYDDPERWWDDLIESRMDGQSPFAALTEAMAQVRAASPAPPDGQLQEQRREAYMRQVLRAALRDTARAGQHGPVAVVCGAWHAPALTGRLPPGTADAAVLRGMPKRKTALAWVPWTHSRLAAASGYGAGITSPGWYHHLFTTREHTVIRWLTRVAGVLRAHDLPVSSAHVIEAARLADALATLRGRPLAGLAEVSEATEAVLCDGDEHATGFVTRDLVVGELLGSVPDAAPAGPAGSGSACPGPGRAAEAGPAGAGAHPGPAHAGRPGPVGAAAPAHRARHRLGHGGRGPGPGDRHVPRDVGAALAARTRGGRHRRRAVGHHGGRRPPPRRSSRRPGRPGTWLASVPRWRAFCWLICRTRWIRCCAALDEKAARDADVARLMTAVPALVRAVRYGDVRGTDTAALSAVVAALTARVCAGLPAAVSSLADDAAAGLARRAGRDAGRAEPARAA